MIWSNSPSYQIFFYIYGYFMLPKLPYISNHYFLSFQTGKEKGFAFFFQSFYKALCFFANRYTRDLPAAEDIVSEAFIRVWEKRERISSVGGLKSYLYTTVYHACLRWIERKRAIVNGKEAMEERTVLDNMIRAEVMNEILRSIEMLPTECRRIFTKLFLEGKTVKEIAEELSLSVSTVKTQKARALNFLRTKLSPMCLVVFISSGF